MRFLPLALLILCPAVGVGQQPPQMLELRGETMGTRYSVKIFDPPELKDAALAVDAELRRVNDQMSHYLKSSEVGRFNQSDSTDWFAVSPETAKVVAFAQQLAEMTGGAFDVTVGPLVNAWSFGPDRGDRVVPSDETIAALRERVGYEKLEVRLDPPAIRKTIPTLQLDLSAIAKGHGVDRVVELLNGLGADNVFVEIGGEVRTTGDKAGQPWRVGIQLPDAAADSVMAAHAMESGGPQALATSGDYRLFFEVDGQRYSHTIDPRSGAPVEHPLASVSVLAPTCMAADAWATALNVVGPVRALELAVDQGWDTLLVSRTDDGYALSATGALLPLAESRRPVASEAAEPEAAADGSALAIFLLTVISFGVLLSAMAVGVMFGRRAISGSCGGLANERNDDGSVSCSLCSNPDNACRELRRRMQTSSPTDAS